MRLPIVAGGAYRMNAGGHRRRRTYRTEPALFAAQERFGHGDEFRRGESWIPYGKLVAGARWHPDDYPDGPRYQ